MMIPPAVPQRLAAPDPGWTDTADIVVIGSGIAGLTAALRARGAGRVLVVTKDVIASGSTQWAQGGIAAALDPADTPDEHLQDTLVAGAGLCDEDAVRALVTEGAEAVRELIGLGAEFDRTASGQLSLTREGGHHRNRIAHAGGDATGAEIERTLVAAVRNAPEIRIIEHALVLDLLTSDDGAVAGVTLHVMGEGQLDGVGAIRCRAVVLATGGMGQIYAATTNPSVSTGDGVALALRAGAVLSDVEFVQFHPTVFYREDRSGAGVPQGSGAGVPQGSGAGVPQGSGAGVPQGTGAGVPQGTGAGVPRGTGAGVPEGDRRGQQLLISEAMRGEGALLRDAHGERFMPAVHELAELAPRDVVAKAITRVMREQGVRHVWLDARGLGADVLLRRFPSIVARCRELGIDPVAEPIPVAPAAHYASGGVRTDLAGRTSIPGLYACGEVACTGVHGANRLASNSLLEGLVYAGRIGADLARGLAPQADPVDDGAPAALLDPGIRGPLQDAMTRGAGMIRSADSLAGTAATVDGLAAHGYGKPEPDAWEVTDLHTVAAALVHAAGRRQETRGCHWREDFPDRDDRRWRGHLRVTLAGDGTLTDTYEA